jgi:hypothetical protein
MNPRFKRSLNPRELPLEARDSRYQRRVVSGSARVRGDESDGGHVYRFLHLIRLLWNT